MKSQRKPQWRPHKRRADTYSDLQAKTDRKLQQLCRQVERALSYVVPGDLGDPALQDLSIASVLPAPDASRLLVCINTTRAPSEAPLILERLERARGRLRREVAAAVTRKRAPELVFRLIAMKEVEP